MAKVLFLQDTLCEYAGLAILSACLKAAGHETDLAVVDGKRDLAAFPAQLDAIRPDLCAFSTVSIGLDRRLEIAAICKAKGYLTIFGGPHPTFHPELVEDWRVDLSCRGEGEEAIVDVADRIDEGARSVQEFAGIANVSWMSGDVPQHPPMRRLVDIDALPFHDRGIYYDRFPVMAKFSNKRVHVSRGCPHVCTFCDAVTLRKAVSGLGKFVRYRSPDSIIEEIRRLQADWGFRTLTLTAETFTANRRWALKFLEQYAREVRVPFLTAAVYSELDEEMIKALADAGCHCLTIGLESGNETIRQDLLKKRFSNDFVRDIGRLLKKYDIRLMSFVMFGSPTETLETAWETVDLEVEIGAMAHSPTLLQPYKGTEILDYIQERTLLRDGVTEHDIFHKPVGMAVKSDDRQAIENLQKLSWLVLQWPQTRPLVEKLVKLPPNPAFSAVLLACLTQKYLSSRQIGVREFTKYAVHLRRDYKSFFW